MSGARLALSPLAMTAATIKPRGASIFTVSKPIRSLADMNGLRVFGVPEGAAVELYHRRDHGDVRVLRAVTAGADLRLPAGKTATLALPEGHTAALVPMHAAITVNGTVPAAPAQLVEFERQGGEFSVAAAADTAVLVLGGAPLGERVVGYGPFVMNSEAEIAEAIRDFQSGRFGQL